MYSRSRLSETKIGYVALAGAFSLAGSSVVAGKYLVDQLPAFTITAVSMLFAVVALLPAVAIEKGRASGTGSGRGESGRGRQLVSAAAQGLVGIVLYRLFLLAGLARTTAMEAGLITSATPAITALLAIVVLREVKGLRRIVGIALAVLGMMAMNLGPGGGAGRSNLAGNLLVLGAAACESAFNILSKRQATQAGLLNPMAHTTAVSAWALAFSLPFALREGGIVALSSLGPTGWVALAYYGVMVTGVAYVLWYIGIARIEASVAGAFSGFVPMSSTLLAIAVLGESPSPALAFGGLLTISGILLVVGGHGPLL